MNRHNDMLDAVAYSYVFMPIIPAKYRTVITHANIDVESKTYKTLIPIKKKRKNKSLKSFAIYLIKTSQRNRLKMKGRNRQIHRWRYEICDCRFNGIGGGGLKKRKMIKRFYFLNAEPDIELQITKEVRPCRECGGIGQVIRLQYRDLKFVRCKKCGKRTRMFEYFRQAITAWVLGDIFKPDIREDKNDVKAQCLKGARLAK